MIELTVEEQRVKNKILSMVHKTVTGCWLWQGGRTDKGYGSICFHGRVGVHRASYEVHLGKIPDGLCVLHKCDVRHCVNPDHLFLGTYADNNHDRTVKGRLGKLTNEHAAEIKAARGNRADIVASFAARFKVTSRTIRNVLNGATWKEVNAQ